MAGLAVTLAVFVALKPVDGLHEYVAAPVAVSVVFAPLQIVASLPAFTTGNWFTVTVLTALVALQPFAVTVTLYDVVLVGVTVIEALVAPVLHKYVVPALAVNVVLVPAHTVVVPLIVAVGNGVTVIAVALDVVEHPVLFVTVTV